jgi:hypothetical protein
MFDPLADLSRARSRRWRPPRQPRSLLDFSRTMTLPDGPAAGTKFIPESEPTQINLLRLIDSGRYRRIVLVWPSQRGKTLLGIILPWLHSICEMRDSVGYLMPTLDKLSQNWEGKIKPAITGAGFEAWLPTKGPGSKGGRPAALPMRDPETGRVAARTYFMALGGGGKETSTSSVSPRVICVDEADDAESAGQLELSFKRTASYGAQGRAYVVSTVNTGRARESHPILDLAATGTMSRVHHRCPHCGDMAPITRARLVGSALVCLACSATWSDNEARDALNRSEIRNGNDSAGTLSLICVGPDFHLGGGLVEIAAQRDRAEAAQAGGDQTLMTLYLNKVWCEHHDLTNKDEQGQTSIPTANRLAALASQSPVQLDVDRREKDGDSVHLVHLPAECEHQAIGVDVQRGGDRAPARLYFVALGRRPSAGRTWLTGWGTIALGPVGRQATDGEIMAGLDRLRDLLGDWNPSAPIVRRLVDINDGGWMADEKRAANAAVLRWLRQNPTWWGIRGTAAIKPELGDIPDWIYHRSEGQTRIRHVVTLNAIRTIHGEVLSGSLILPQALSERGENNQYPAIVQHWCGTVEYEPGKWSEKKEHRKYHPEWQRRIDYLHSAAYARAGLKEWESRNQSPSRRKYGLIREL